MRWWLITDTKQFSVDNAVVKGLDFSALDPSIFMVQWTDGRGEIERQVDINTNHNGLREAFVDILPYVGYFRQFLTVLPLLTLVQAQKVITDLIGEVYNSKRQAPFHYAIVAGDYSWDATDNTLFSSTAAGLSNTTATLNALIDKVNALVAAVNANIVAGVNTNVVAAANTNIVGGVNAIATVGNSVITQVNSHIVDTLNASLVPALNGIFAGIAAEVVADFAGISSEISGNIVAVGNASITHLNGTVLGFIGDGVNTVNNKLQDTTPTSPPSTIDGLDGNIAGNPYTFFGISNYTISTYSVTYSVGQVAGGFANIAGVSGISGVSWADQAHVPVATTTWIPVGSTTPVVVTPTEQAAIISGISARAADLAVKKNIKIGQVRALTTIPAVIAYDVTTGW